MRSSLQQKRIRKKRNVGEGINFILRHFPEDKIFPRTISIKDSSGEQFVVYNKKEMFRAYKQANFIDCEVSAYAAYSAEKYIHDNGINMQTPDFIFLEINNRSLLLLSSSPPPSSIDGRSRLIDQVKVLYAILQNIKELLYGANPTVLWAGNCFQIYQPVQAITLEELEEEFIDLKHVREFRRFFTQQYLLSNLFLEFSKQKILLLHNKNNDYYHYYYYQNNHSNKPCRSHDPLYESLHDMLMIPGTLNSKCNSSGKEHEVQIIQTWDGNRPKIDLLLNDFQKYLLALKVYRRTNSGTIATFRSDNMIWDFKNLSMRDPSTYLN